MVERGKIETYQPYFTITDSYIRHDKWGTDFIYLTYKKLIKSTPPQQQHAESALILNKIKAKEYNIQYITVSHEKEGLASSLLDKLCKDADQSEIILTHELFINSENVGHSRYLLTKFDFKDTSQIFAVPSRDPVTTSLPSGEKLTLSTVSLCPSRVRTNLPSAKFQIFAVPSCDPVTTSLPSGENSTALTPSLCPQH